MVQKLLQQVFERAEELSGKTTVNGKAEYLAGHLLDEQRFSVSAKSLIRYYKGESSPGPEVRDHLSIFLGYNSYENFILTNSSSYTKKTSAVIRKTTRKKVLLAMLVFPMVGIPAYVGYQSGEEECMRWEKDHFEQVSCTGSRYEEPLNPVRLENFKKLLVSDTTSFFRNGEPRVWYDKSNGKLEFFSAPGIHPENGKTLKPITRYMIKKYIRN